MEKLHDVAIVGAGPAGIAAAVYLKRTGADVAIFEHGRIGGLLLNANLVENYPGFPEGIGGRELARLFDSQLRRWKIAVTKEEVRKVSHDKGSFKVVTDGGEHRARFLIVATGTRPKGIAMAGEDTLTGKRLFYEVAGLPRGHLGKKFLVVGGGDAAFDYALGIAANGGTATVIFKSVKARCIPLLLERAEKEPRIRLVSRTHPMSVREEGRNVILTCKQGRYETEFQGDLVLVACGRMPNMDIVPAGLLKASGRPGKDGLFIVGDASRGGHRQVGIAVGDGISAAMEVADRIREVELHEDTR